MPMAFPKLTNHQTTKTSNNQRKLHSNNLFIILFQLREIYQSQNGTALLELIFIFVNIIINNKLNQKS